MKTGDLVIFLETDMIDSFYWGRTGLVVSAVSTDSDWRGTFESGSVLVDNDVLPHCACGFEIEVISEVVSEAR
jgi:hypothetical protein